MTALAGSLYVVSTIAFSVLCMVIGVRLVLLSRRTGARPELYLGVGLLLTGGLGYGLVAGSAIAAASLGADARGLRGIGLFGLLLHHIGVAWNLAFIVTVFRPTERWARALAVTLLAILAASWIGMVFGDQPAGALRGGGWYRLGSAVTANYPFWITFEALHYYGLMRRRQAIGLADPVVTNRFLLWGIASLFAAAAVWTAALPGLLVSSMAEQARLAPLILSVTGILGIGSIATYWLTFFPPRWYLRTLTAEE
jgi:hypothetical protein